MKIEDFNGIAFPVYFKNTCHYYKATGMTSNLLCVTYVTDDLCSIEFGYMSSLNRMFTDNDSYTLFLNFCTKEEFDAAFEMVVTRLKTELNIK
jgi:hypothetical protein